MYNGFPDTGLESPSEQHTPLEKAKVGAAFASDPLAELHQLRLDVEKMSKSQKQKNMLEVFEKTVRLATQVLDERRERRTR
jgi:hypothetical protein